MTLADQIIEHGPYQPGHIVLASFASGLLHVEGLNQLRDELLELRRLRALLKRLDGFQLDANLWDDQAAVWCLTCRTRWGRNDGLTLAELVRRADQHGEECR